VRCGPSWNGAKARAGWVQSPRNRRWVQSPRNKGVERRWGEANMVADCLYVTTVHLFIYLYLAERFKKYREKLLLEMKWHLKSEESMKSKKQKKRFLS
jgi:hypothetical protein